MFRPMAVTMACALFGALVYSVLFFPALLAIFVPPSKGHGRVGSLGWVSDTSAPCPGRSTSACRSWSAVAWRSWLRSWCSPTAALISCRASREGDAVVTVRRAPSIGLAQAKELDLAAERVLRRFPEVVTSLGMTGRAEVAIDPVGNDNTDIFVHLKPEKEVDQRARFGRAVRAVQARHRERGRGHVRVRVAAHRRQDQRADQWLARRRADRHFRRVTRRAEEAERTGRGDRARRARLR